MLWTGNPFGWPKGGAVNNTLLVEFLNATNQLRDVVDIVSPVTFYLAPPTNASKNGGLVMNDGAEVVIRGLQKHVADLIN